MDDLSSNLNIRQVHTMIPGTNWNMPTSREFDLALSIKEALGPSKYRREALKVFLDDKPHYMNEMYRILKGSKTSAGKTLRILSDEYKIIKPAGRAIKEVRDSPGKARTVFLYRIDPEYLAVIEKYRTRLKL